MMSLYNAYGKKDTITMNKDKIVFMSVLKDEILKSYEQNTSRILTPKSSLITETNITTLKKVITVNFIRTNNDKVCVEVEEAL